MPDIQEPKMVAELGRYKFDFQDIGIKVDLSRLDNDGFGELAIWHQNGAATPTLLHLAKHNLLSTTSSTSLARRLNQNLEIDWATVLTYVAQMTLTAYRAGEPVQMLGGKPTSTKLQYLIEPILELGEPTTFYGPGGSAKSYLADLFAVMVAYGIPALGWRPSKRCNVLYLDYESGYDLHKRRIWAIKQGLGIKEPDEPIFYRFGTQPLSTEAPELQSIIVENSIGFTIIDSQMAASTTSQDHTYNAVAYYNALRSFRHTTFTVDHVSKQDWREDSAATGPINSVVKWNRSRSQFEVKRTQEPGADCIEVALLHRKQNEGRLLKSIGIRIKFDMDIDDDLRKVDFERFDIVDNVQLAKNLSISEAIFQALSINGKLTISELSDISGKESKSLQAELYRQQKKGRLTQVGSNKLGDIFWGLAAREEFQND